ncbi:MAG TPA: hypothetical protein VGE98_00775, partial [Thermoanaerobaculia bacterium]
HSDNPEIYPIGRKVTIVPTPIDNEFDLHWLTTKNHPSSLVRVPYNAATSLLQGSQVRGIGPDGEALYDVEIGPFDPDDPHKHEKIAGSVSDAVPTTDSGGLAGLWGADAKPPVGQEEGGGAKSAA